MLGRLEFRGVGRQETEPDNRHRIRNITAMGSLPPLPSTRLTTSGCCGCWRTGSPILESSGSSGCILESDEWFETDRGTPQGAGISPLLANIFRNRPVKGKRRSQATALNCGIAG
jgi:hypothetical protein